MNSYRLHRVNVYAESDLSKCMMLLRKEMGGNEFLRVCPDYSITIRTYEEWDDHFLKGCVRIGFHPQNQKEIWQSELGTKTIELGMEECVLRMGDACVLYLRNLDNVYSYLRSRVCEVIRDHALQLFPFGLHGALIGKGSVLSVVIGDKGSGKTSSMLYAYEQGWDIYTDELVLLDQTCVNVLERFPALAPDVENRFFAKGCFPLHCKIKGYLTNEDKNILAVPIKKCLGFTFSDIQNIFVLSSPENETLISEYKKHIFLRNFILGQKQSQEQYEMIGSLICRSELLTISGLVERIQGEGRYGY